MDAAPHQITGRIIDQAMAGDGILATENLSNDFQFVVAAFARAGVTGMAMRLVFNDYFECLQAGQSLAQLFGDFSAHAGKTFLNGLTVTFS